MKDFKIGDVVTIRQYDDMASEFLEDDSYGIPGPPGCYAFIRDMMRYCGKQFTINNADSHSDITELVYDLVDKTGMLIPRFFS